MFEKTSETHLSCQKRICSTVKVSESRQITGDVEFAAQCLPAHNIKLGNFSKFIAEKITAKGANFVSDLVRSGKDGNEIIKTYLKGTPKSQRSSEELTQLLMQPDVKLASIRSQSPIAKEAVSMIENFKPEELAIAFGLVAPNLPAEEVVQ